LAFILPVRIENIVESNRSAEVPSMPLAFLFRCEVALLCPWHFSFAGRRLGYCNTVYPLLIDQTARDDAQWCRQRIAARPVTLSSFLKFEKGFHSAVKKTTLLRRRQCGALIPRDASATRSTVWRQ